VRRVWADYGLGIVLALLWALCLALHGYGEWQQSLYPHDAAPWALQWFTTAFENAASEFLQLFSFVVLAKYLVFKGSPQSRDGDDEVKSMIKKLLSQARRDTFTPGSGD
jgi:cell division protein FtsW (lipid II flippase)